MSASVKPFSVRIEGHYRRALTKRWFELNLRALVYVSSVTSLATLILTSSFKTSLLAVGIGALTYPITVYPILAVRRSFITSPLQTPPVTSLTRLVFTLTTSPRKLRFLATYLSFGIAFASVYCFLVTLGEPYRDFGLWSPTPRHPWHLNERHIFLVLGSALLFTYLGAREILSHQVDPVWPRNRKPLWVRARESLMAAFEGALPITLAYCLVYSLGYFALRKWVWRFLLVHSGGSLRPFIVNFLKASRNTITWSLILHLYCLEMVSLAVVRLPAAVVNAYVTHPLSFEPFMRKSTIAPDRYLLAALESQDTYHLHFTLMELARIVHDPVRRKAMFSDISKTTPLTHDIWQQLLLHLGRANYKSVTRGGSRPLASPTAQQTVKTPDPRAIPIRQAEIFRPVIKKPSSYGLSLLDGPTQAVPPEPVLKLSQRAMHIEGVAIERAKQLQHQVVGRIEATPTGHTVLDETQGWIDASHAWAGMEWARRNVQRALPDPDATRLIVEIFATLAVASAEEDLYGHVQKVLPATLEAIVRFRATVLSLESELIAQSVLLGRGQYAAAAEIKQRLGPSQTACGNGIQRIGDKFGKTLSAFRFPPAIASALTDICRHDPQAQETQAADTE